MTILGQNPNDPTPFDIQYGHETATIKRMYNQMCAYVEKELVEIKHIVDTTARRNIDDAMGNDRDEFETFYYAAKDFVQNHPDCIVSDLPLSIRIIATGTLQGVGTVI